jgi:hypothetical protein
MGAAAAVVVVMAVVAVAVAEAVVVVVVAVAEVLIELIWGRCLCPESDVVASIARLFNTKAQGDWQQSNCGKNEMKSTGFHGLRTRAFRPKKDLTLASH